MSVGEILPNDSITAEKGGPSHGNERFEFTVPLQFVFLVSLIITDSLGNYFMIESVFFDVPQAVFNKIFVPISVFTVPVIHLSGTSTLHSILKTCAEGGPKLF